MDRNFIFVMLAVLLVGIFAFSANIQKANASGIIYIRADGSIDPSTSPIMLGPLSTYTLTADIYDSDGIVIQRDGITLNGAGCIIEGNGGGNGLLLVGRKQVAVTNMTIRQFTSGIYLNSSSLNVISGNNVADNSNGVWLVSSDNNTVTQNNINNNQHGIIFVYSDINYVKENCVTNNGDNGIRLLDSVSNTIWKNNITDNTIGVSLGSSSSNKFFHNRFTDNAQQVSFETSFDPNTWDDGFSSGGNYWSDYEERYPDASEIGNSGIGNTPYTIVADNQDRYPFFEGEAVSPCRWCWFWAIVAVVIVASVAGGAYLLRVRKKK